MASRCYVRMELSRPQEGVYNRCGPIWHNIGYNFDFSQGRNMRVYISGQNLLVWTDYPGYDPEVRTYTKNPQKRGVDFGTYPGTKSVLFGLKFNY